jgi:hypothetical protein
VTRTEFAAAVAGLLTVDQKRQIRDLHDQVQEAYEFGCCAHNEGDDCCVDVLKGERWKEMRP